MSKTYPYRYDNCKDCIARCPHAGKDRKFVYHGFKSCKVVKEPLCPDRSAWKCGICEVPTHWVEWGKLGYEYCPHCGRPLTDAAWEMLERRLAGHENQ